MEGGEEGTYLRRGAYSRGGANLRIYYVISVLTLDKIKLNDNQYGELLFQF